MTSLKRILALSGLTGLLGALAFAAPASADLKAICIVDGEVHAHTTKPQFKKYVQVLGGHGTYEFAGVNTVCVDIGKGKAPGTAHIGMVHATGAFKQVIVLKSDPNGRPIEAPCGWGKVTGVITRQYLGTKFNALVGAKFAIEFGPPAKIGFFFWHHTGPATKNPPVPKTFRSSMEGQGPTKPGPKPYRWAGTIQLGAARHKEDDPAKRMENQDKCAKSFAVDGVVFVHEFNNA